MFGDPFLIRQFPNFLKLFDNLRKNLLTDISDDKPSNVLVTALYFKTKVRSSKYKKARYAIGNVSEKDLSKIIKELEKIGKPPYEKKRPKMSLLPATFI